jgi:hypothetical protein
VLFSRLMSTGSGVKAIVVLTQQEIYKANVAIAQSRRSPKRRFVSGLITGLAFAVIVHLALLRSDADAPWWPALLGGASFILIFELAFMALLIRAAAFYSARGLVRSKPTVLEPLTYDFSPSGSSWVGPTGSGTFEWKTFVRIQETKEQFLLYPQKSLANIIPKRSFQSEADIQRFRQLIRENFQGELNLIA